MSFLSKVELKRQLQALGIKVEGNYVRKKELKKVLAETPKYLTDAEDYELTDTLSKYLGTWVSDSFSEWLILYAYNEFNDERSPYITSRLLVDDDLPNLPSIVKKAAKLTSQQEIKKWLIENEDEIEEAEKNFH